ncbi:uncharacterized protein AMSG_04553 [Thecamonas trahens ATCC 50062]|uniref:AB hydrolase-1 domain-containing protein n=1 Tax=Thecamonas trahens ATCC 50062 TaxID=461836 RepID=A0A0L0D7F9_THETB|nr:hypothetical protein AMSG_04553 [Thecamonas trahens ATCC 50062]KNC48322.1 hypothetical protein AMSG_04553 [Thecamonas trahens ATCC 50062]|eukprot:XP_013758889.1 hypothetical protein AMSG_04553 [Thecamonas trahens ATCC 50062]
MLRLPRTMVTVHGYLASTWNNYPLAVYLRTSDSSANVAAFGYDSRAGVLADHATALRRFVDTALNCTSRCGGPEPPLGFVTHSMGGLVLAAALADVAALPPDRRSRGDTLLASAPTVMIAPPLRGSLWAASVHELVGLTVVAGPGTELAAMARSVDLAARYALPSSLPLLVVTGEKSWSNPILSRLADGRPHDGTILNDESIPLARDGDNAGADLACARMHVPGAGHSLLQFRLDVMEGVTEFLAKHSG